MAIALIYTYVLSNCPAVDVVSVPEEGVIR